MAVNLPLGEYGALVSGFKISNLRQADSNLASHILSISVQGMCIRNRHHSEEIEC